GGRLPGFTGSVLCKWCEHSGRRRKNRYHLTLTNAEEQMENYFENSRGFAQQLDKEDPLKRFRAEFIIPAAEGKQQIYFLGNSLGLQPVRTARYMQQVMDTWASYG